MTTVLLVRHGLTATTGQVLTGWTPGVSLDERGRAQAKALADRLVPVPLAAVVTSPLDRCRETAEAIIAARVGDGRPDGAPGGHPAEGQPAEGRLADGRPAGTPPTGESRPAELTVDERVGECKYGDWTGKPLKELAKDPLWPVVQAHPSAVRFPGPAGESMLDMQHRAVTAVREWNDRLGSGATYVICSHGDVIKAIVADSLGLHLDQCQRIVADPCSLTVIRYTPLRPFVLRMNDTGGGVTDLLPSPASNTDNADNTESAAAETESDAVIGGGAGSAGG